MRASCCGFIRILYVSMLLFISGAGCTHLEYTRVWERGSATLKDEEFGPKKIDFEDYGVNQITWLDPTGTVCAGAQTGLSELSAAKSARDKAIEDRKYTYNYTYNIYAPIAGVYCGLYYRWGSGRTIIRDAPPKNAVQTQEDVSTEGSLWELGFHVQGTEQLESFNWMTYTFSFALAVGRYQWTNPDPKALDQIKIYDDPFLFRLPLWGGVGLFPPFLYGFGLKAQGGADLIAWALSSGAGQWYQKFDYEVGAAYELKAFNPLILGASAGLRQDNLHWGEYWLKRQGPYANLSISYVF